MDQPPSDTESHAIKLEKLGVKIAQARSNAGIKQGELAQRIAGKIGYKFTQTNVTRLERGQIADPPKEVLRAISEELDVNFYGLLADLISDKYAVDESILFPFTREPMAFDEVARWEEDPDHGELWICVSKFVDNQRRAFKKAISNILRRDGSVTFFLPSGISEAFESYRRGMIRSASAELKKSEEELRQRLLPVPLMRNQVAFLLGSFTIANPTRGLDGPGPGPTGYLALTDEYGKFILGLKMTESEVLAKVDELRDIREDYIHRLNEEAATRNPQSDSAASNVRMLK